MNWNFYIAGLRISGAGVLGASFSCQLYIIFVKKKTLKQAEGIFSPNLSMQQFSKLLTVIFGTF